MEAIFEALKVGVKVTWWIFKRLFIGYFDMLRWLEARGRGAYHSFPVVSFSLAVLLTIFLIWFGTFARGSNQGSNTPINSQPTYRKIWPTSTRNATATAVAKQTVAAGGVLPTRTPRPSRTPTPPPAIIPKARLILSIEPTQVKIGNPFTATVTLDPGGHKVRRFGFLLSYHESIR